MKKIIVTAIIAISTHAIFAQVMPPDSVDKTNNSAAARKKGLHTNGATNEVKQGSKQAMKDTAKQGSKTGKQPARKPNQHLKSSRDSSVSQIK